MTDDEHAAAIRRIDTILRTMDDPDSPLRTMLTAGIEPPAPPALADVTRAAPEATAHRLAVGRLRILRGSLLDASPDDGHEYRILQEVRALLATGQGAFCFSHSTAALLHGAWTYATPFAVHVTHQANPHVRRDREPDVRRHHTRLHPRELEVVNGIPVTSKERTLVDCLRTLQPASAIVVADSMFRLGADPAEVSRIMSASRGKRGMKQARRLLGICDPRSGAPGESVARLAAIDDGLPLPVCQMPVETRSGVKFVDFGWPEVGAGVEFDGEVKYLNGALGAQEEVRRREKRRHDDVVAAGCDLLRVGWDDLRDVVQLGFDIRTVYDGALRRGRGLRRGA
jgi:hypothetical protein